jgi:uncharacterized membrane protein YkvA (DUF1232 family)
MDIQSLKDKSKEMKTNLGVLFLAFKHNRTPWYAKALIGLVISYALSPVDLIPDFIPVLGYLDDLILIPGGIALAIKLIPDDIISECKEKQRQNEIAMSGMYAGILIVAIWLIILYFFVKFIMAD